MAEDYKAGERTLALVSAERTFGTASLETELAARSFVGQAWGICGGNPSQFPAVVVSVIDADIAAAKVMDSTIVGDKVLVYLRDAKTAKIGLIAFLISTACSLSPEKSSVRSGGVPKTADQTDIYAVASRWVKAYDGGPHSPAAAVRIILSKVQSFSSLDEIKAEIKAVTEATERHKAAAEAAEAAAEATTAWAAFDAMLKVQIDSLYGVEVAGVTSVALLRRLAATATELADRTEAATKAEAAK